MSDASKALVAKLLAARESWFELEPGKRLKIRRPAEVQMAELRRGISVEDLGEFVIDWEGFSQADLLGAAIGSDAVVPFDADVWKVAVADRNKWFNAAAREVIRLMTEHLQSKAEAEKN